MAPHLHYLITGISYLVFDFCLNVEVDSSKKVICQKAESKVLFHRKRKGVKPKRFSNFSSWHVSKVRMLKPDSVDDSVKQERTDLGAKKLKWRGDSTGSSSR